MISMDKSKYTYFKKNQLYTHETPSNWKFFHKPEKGFEVFNHPTQILHKPCGRINRCNIDI